MSAAAAATNAIGWRASTTPAQSVEWGTPPALYLALDREFGFTIDIAADPAMAKHVRFVAKETDALTLSWAGERVFANPPYGRGLDRWMRKGFTEASEHGALVVMLVPARTGNAWFHDYALPHAEVRFIRGRLSYQRDGQPTGRQHRCPFDSCVVIFRPHSRGAGRIIQQHVMPFLSRVV
jgi:site-specific DNA-methyltransferase (adenine-specific)